MSTTKVIPCTHWCDAATQPKAVLVCLHGMGLHGGAFRDLGERLTKHKIVTCAVDIRGFGKWNEQGENCLLSFPECLEDLRSHIDEIELKYPGVPIYLLGESLGGAIAMNFAATNPDSIKGLILSAPARLDTHHHLELMRVTWRVISERSTAVCIEENMMRYAPNVVQFQTDESPVRWNFTLGELLHTAKFLLQTYRLVDRIASHRVLLVQGHADTLITTKTTLDIFERMPTKEKQLVILGDADHLIFQLPKVKASAINLVADWITQHSEQSVETADFQAKRLKRAS